MRDRYPFRIIFLIISAAFTVSGQEQQDSQTKSVSPVTMNPAGKQEPASERTTADETFELNIDERRIVREHFEASTALAMTESPQGVDLRIGVSLSAERIDVLLRNVRGRVRFRGSLERMLDILNTRRGTPVPR